MIGDFGFEIGISRIIGRRFEGNKSVVIRFELDVDRINRLPAFRHDFDVMEPRFGRERRHLVNRSRGLAPFDFDRNAKSVVNAHVDVENTPRIVPERRNSDVAWRGHEDHLPVDFIASRRINFVARDFVDLHPNGTRSKRIVIDFRRASR